MSVTVLQSCLLSVANWKISPTALSACVAGLGISDQITWTLNCSPWYGDSGVSATDRHSWQKPEQQVQIFLSDLQNREAADLITALLDLSSAGVPDTIIKISPGDQAHKPCELFLFVFSLPTSKGKLQPTIAAKRNSFVWVQASGADCKCLAPTWESRLGSHDIIAGGL